jgi:hypothetical protein
MEANIQLFLSVITLLSIIFFIYKYFRDPDIKSDQEIQLIKQNCESKHKNIDENIFGIKENHLKHLESDMSEVKINICKILTILEERNKGDKP